MLIKKVDSEEYDIVMGLVIDIKTRQLKFIHSAYGNHRAQYVDEAKDYVVVDSSFPDFWEYGYDLKTNEHIFSFPELVSDLGQPGRPGFYERYLEGEPVEVAVFKQYFLSEKQKHEDNPKLAKDTQL